MILKGGSTTAQTPGWTMAAQCVSVAMYQWGGFVPLILRAGDPVTMDIIIGCIALCTVFAAAWALIGPALPVIAGLFLSYCQFGEYLPRPFNHRGDDFSQVIDHMAFGTEGIYAIPTYVSSTFIFCSSCSAHSWRKHL